jgi:hypothetical protein
VRQREKSPATYNVADDPSAVVFAMGIMPSAAKISACGAAGCIVIIQSLYQVGTYNPCSGNPGGTTCQTYQQAFQNIGATLILPNVPENDRANLAYSFIGNVGSVSAMEAGLADHVWSLEEIASLAS